MRCPVPGCDYDAGTTCAMSDCPGRTNKVSSKAAQASGPNVTNMTGSFEGHPPEGTSGARGCEWMAMANFHDCTMQQRGASNYGAR